MVLPAAAAIDLLSQLLMWPPYFRVGIPLYFARRSIASNRPLSGIAGDLRQKQSSSHWVPLRIEAVCDGELLIREEFFALKVMYAALVHGRLTYNPKSNELQLVCFANLLPVALICLIAEAGLFAEIEFMAAVAIIMLSILAVQLTRYTKVWALAAKLLSGLSGRADR